VPFEDRTWGSLEEIGVGRYPEAAIDADGNAMTTWEETGVEGCVAGASHSTARGNRTSRSSSRYP
jgi:hypothetical protein